MSAAPAAPTRIVYLLDDEAAVLDALGFLLASRGLDVRAHASGATLLATVDATPRPLPGVFLIDIRMAPMSGLHVFDALVARRLRNPVLFLSGHGDIPMAVDALKKGAFDFLEKPYSDNALADRVEQALAVDAAMHQTDARTEERQARLASLTEREHEVMLRDLGRQAEQDHRRRASCVGAHGRGSPGAGLRQAGRALCGGGGDLAGGLTASMSSPHVSAAVPVRSACARRCGGR